MKSTSFKSGGLFQTVRTRWIDWVAFAFFILLLSFLQSAPHALEIAGARPLLLVASTVCIACFTGPIGGGIAGAFAGILWDMFSTRLLGFDAIILLCIGTACGFIIWTAMRNNVFTILLMTTCACVVQIFLDWSFHYFVYGYDHPLKALLVVYAPNGLYTVLISPIIFFAVLALKKYLQNHE